MRGSPVARPLSSPNLALSPVQIRAPAKRASWHAALHQCCNQACKPRDSVALGANAPPLLREGFEGLIGSLSSRHDTRYPSHYGLASIHCPAGVRNALHAVAALCDRSFHRDVKRPETRSSLSRFPRHDVSGRGVRGATGSDRTLDVEALSGTTPHRACALGTVPKEGCDFGSQRKNFTGAFGLVRRRCANCSARALATLARHQCDSTV